MENWNVSPSPDILPDGSSLNGPTYTAPDLCVPELLSDDLTRPGLDLVPAMEADPTLIDLLQYDLSGNLTIYPADGGLLVNSPDYNAPDYPHNLALSPGPALTDLQHVALNPEVLMSDRPGDLASNALNELESDPDYQSLPVHDSDQLFLVQNGENSSRTRRLGRLELGLEHGERL